MSLENCPKCEKKLPPPFKSSGRQVCSKCAWSSKPVKAAPEPQFEEVKENSQDSIAERVSTLVSSLTKKQIMIISGLAIASIVGVGSRIAWANSNVYCVNDDKKIAADVLKSYLAKWEDRTDLAHSTSRMNLPTVIPELQDIKREVEFEKWGECAKPAIDLLTSSMDFKIEGFIKFLDSDNPNYIVQGKMENASLEMKEFEEEYQTLRFEQPRKFWDRYLAEQEAKELLGLLSIKQDFVYGKTGKYETKFKNLKTPDSNVAKYARKNLKDYKIVANLEKERLTTKLLPKSRGLKSFVQIIEPSKNEKISMSNSLICESIEPAKNIESPAFNKHPQCPNGTSLVTDSWLDSLF